MRHLVHTQSAMRDFLAWWQLTSHALNYNLPNNQITLRVQWAWQHNLMHTTGKDLLNLKMIYYLSKIYQKSDINVENNHASIDLENFSNLRQNFTNFWYMIDLFLPKFGKCKCSCATLSKRRLQLGLECCCITQYHFSLLRQGFAVCLWFHCVQNLFFRLFPIISISQKIFSIFFLTLEKIGIDEKVICYHNISN